MYFSLLINPSPQSSPQWGEEVKEKNPQSPLPSGERVRVRGKGGQIK